MTLREWAIQIIAAFAGGMISVVFGSFVLNLVRYLKRRDWEPW